MSSDPSPSGLVERLFPGSGEMADLMRRKDWAATPLGPVETWPPSLRTAVSICLGSRHPIVLWWGPERWMFYNDGYRTMLGESKHPQFMGGSGRECWAEIWHIIGPMMEQVLETGQATWSEDFFLLMTRNGYLEETFFTFSYSPIRDETGRPAGIFNACAETTARVLAERRMKTLRELSVDARTVAEAAQRSGAILAQNARDIPFALVYLRVQDGSRLRLEGHSGLAPGTPASPPEIPADEDDPGWPIARVARTGEPELVKGLATRFSCLPPEPWGEAATQAMVLPIARPGSREPAGAIVLGVSPRRALDEEYRGFFALVAGRVAAAVSSAQAFEAERQRAETLAELDRAKTQFFSNVSHEFRTPLTLMLGPLEDELAERDAPLPPARHERLQVVHRNSLRLLKLVNTLLEFSRIEAGRAQANYEPTDLGKYTAELASSFRSALEKAGLWYILDCPSLPEPVYIDRDMWEKIVLNLISNAFKHTFKGGITVRVRPVEGHAELEVSDTGIGISAADQTRLFERFHRVKGAESRTHEGSGIGLALVKELAALHGGTVSVRSELGKGSTFSVRVKLGRGHLPAERIGIGRGTGFSGGGRAYAEEAIRWLPDPAKGPAAPEPSPTAGRRARILLADDNADMRDYIQRLLGDRYEVFALPDGAAALQAAREEPGPDLILSDVMMPGLDGFGLLKELRTDPRTRAIPFILLSARAGEESAVEGLGAGADDYIVKPFAARELLARVRTHLEIARIRRESARELERANNELEAFSYSVSHDLRAPLRAIDGYAKILIEDHGATLSAEARRLLDGVTKNAHRMGSLIDDLLQFARLGRTELRKSAFDPSALAWEILRELQATCPDRKIETSVGLLPAAWGDPSLLRQVFFNLLSNAVKYTRGRPVAKIDVGSSTSNGIVTYWVKDNGVGFRPEHAGQLFRPFHRLHSEKEFEGTGVGLALVQRIVERHGGKVWAEAELDRGATFFFTLPGKD